MKNGTNLTFIFSSVWLYPTPDSTPTRLPWALPKNRIVAPRNWPLRCVSPRLRSCLVHELREVFETRLPRVKCGDQGPILRLSPDQLGRVYRDSPLGVFQRRPSRDRPAFDWLARGSNLT